MLFNSVEFLIFLLISVLIYQVIPNRIKGFFLLTASYAFYSFWSPYYLIILITITISSYMTGLLLNINISQKNGTSKNSILFIGILFNLIFLVTFKYFNFFNRIINDILSIFGHSFLGQMIITFIPIGISFYTFQSISYMIDVSRGTIKNESNFLRFALFLSFFPQIIAGPITRANVLIPQFVKFNSLQYENVKAGFQLILWGIFKKVVIADRLALSVNYVYNNVEQFNGLSLTIATIFYTFQIYCDFSGYTNIALGIAKIFNISLSENFNFPYISKTVTEFWKRWHITLSTWLRDYLFLPLAYSFSRRFKKRKYILGKTDNIIFSLSALITFFICGFWHGAYYTFIIWGGLHGIILILERLYYKKKLNFIKPGYNAGNFIKWLLTFSFISFSWIFFRANSLQDAFYIVTHIFNFRISEFQTLFISGGIPQLLGLQAFDLFLSIIFLIIFILISFIIQKKGLLTYINELPFYLRWGSYLCISLLILWFGKFGMNEFLYFKF